MTALLEQRLSLAGKVALVTGAAGGQGRAEAQLLHARGAAVVLTDIDPAGRPIAEALGDRAAFVLHDVTSEAHWKEVVATAEQRFGGLDILVNNAGAFQAVPLHETTPALFEQLWRVNQLGVMLGMAAAMDPLHRRGGGSVINIASVGGARGYAGELAYCATKWAVRGMTRCAALELAPLGIRVNCILPGAIDTDMLGPAETRGAWASITPLGRLGRPEEIAEAVAFLASEAASFMTGSDMLIDGGMTV